MSQKSNVYKKFYQKDEMGKVFDYTSSSSILEAIKLVKKGVIYDLGTERYHGMPVDPIHPAFNILSYRTPKGLINQKDQKWLEEKNDVNLRVLSEFISGTMHTGTHIDGLAHITCGSDNHWYNNFTTEKDLGDNGPLKADGSKLLPIFGRGILLDVPEYLGMEALPKNFGINKDVLQKTAEHQGVVVKKGDTVLVRTGYMKTWPDPESQKYFGSGITLDAAKWLSNAGVINVGGDNESLEQDPTENSNNPHPVHTHFLIEEGIHIMEYVEMETLSKDKVYEFLFIAAPLTVRNATGSMINPLAIV